MNWKEQIKNKGLKQKWIAEKIGVSEAMISFVLKGERSLSQEKESELKKLLL